MQQEKCVVFNIPEPDASNSKADCKYVSKLSKDTFDLDVKISKAFHLGKKVLKMQTITSAV